METADDDNCNFWWSVEMEATGSGSEEALMAVADITGSVGSELFDENGVTVLRAVYLSSRDISYWLAALDASRKDFPNVRVRSHSKIENRPWHTEHMDAFPPIPVGAGLIVSAPWHKGGALEKELAASRLPVYIYPSSAFGTGYHESTQIALTFVERFVRKGSSLLDVGTGSGILFIAGLKLGASRAAARDIDPVAVAEAKRNMELNDIPEEACDLRTGDLLSGLGENETKADVVTANILLEPNLKLLRGVKKVMKPSGVAVFSGMTTEERAIFLPVLTEAGLSILAELTEINWWGCAAQ